MNSRKLIFSENNAKIYISLLFKKLGAEPFMFTQISNRQQRKLESHPYFKQSTDLEEYQHSGCSKVAKFLK